MNVQIKTAHGSQKCAKEVLRATSFVQVVTLRAFSRIVVAADVLRLSLPRRLWSRDPAALFAICKQMREAPAHIELDARSLDFIDPLGFAALGATFGSLRDDQRVSMPWLGIDLAEYMDRMDFFHHCAVEGYPVGPLVIKNRKDSSVELTCVSDPSDADETAERLAIAITGNLTHADPHAPPDMATGHNKFTRFSHPLEYSLSELLGNALSHARRDGHMRAAVWVAAQVDTKQNIVRFSVVDNGCGMLSSLRKHSKLVERSHRAAIRLALQPRVSCNRDGKTYADHGNQGVGLTTTSKIASAARGFLTITSGDANVSTFKGVPDRAPMASGAHWDGVAVSFEGRRGRFPSIRISALLPPVVPSDIPILFT
jgi:hypothetical protein